MSIKARIKRLERKLRVNSIEKTLYFVEIDGDEITVSTHLNPKRTLHTFTPKQYEKWLINISESTEEKPQIIVDDLEHWNDLEDE